MGNTTIDPAWGVPGVIPSTSPGWWGARAIATQNGYSLLPDRQDSGGHAVEGLISWLGRGGGSKLEGFSVRVPQDMRFLWTDRDDPNQPPVRLEAVGERPSSSIRAVIRKAGGYVYLSVWIVPDADHWAAATWSGRPPVDGATLPRPIGENPKPFSGNIGGGRIPGPGETVEVRMNGLGSAIVLRRFVEDGFTGLVVLLTNPPDWHRRQNGNGAVCRVFGAELAPIGPI